MSSIRRSRTRRPDGDHPLTIAEKGPVSLRIFDVAGAVRTLVDQVMAPAAERSRGLDGRNDAGDPRRLGAVFLFFSYQVDAPGFTAAKKLVILK